MSALAAVPPQHDDENCPVLLSPERFDLVRYRPPSDSRILAAQQLHAEAGHSSVYIENCLELPCRDLLGI